MHTFSSYDNLTLHDVPSTSSSSGPPSSHVSDRSAVASPRTGQTRCYWTLLTPDLTFLYLDPVFSSHLQEQADLLVGKSLLAFVHPDEQASAKLDLGSVLESRTLHGSVTRVRYSRLSRVRRQLGYHGPLQEWADADKIAVDADYMAVDIVINWASDGLVLCFMHAVVDLTPRDSDEHNKTSWSNWCGTPSMSTEQVQLLYQRLLAAVPQPPNVSRVFQILLNQPDRALYMSWPPDQNQGGPTAKDFARLAQDVQISNAISSGTDAKTNCTRRYKALQVMQCGMDGNREVESIFILHGALIFACHKVNAVLRSGPSGGVQSNYSSQSYTSPSVPYYDPPTHSYSLPPVPAPPSYNGYYGSQPRVPQTQYSGSWSPSSEPQNGQYNQWPPQGGMSPATTVSSLRSSSYPTPQQHQWSSQPPSYMDSNSVPPSFNQPLTSSNLRYSADSANNHHEGPSPSPANDHVPPSRTPRRGSGNSREQYGNGGRSSGNPPVGISKCSSCDATQSPEWRKGPTGKKDLCNACGLRYARSRAKKESGGVSSQGRRRKDRAFSTMSDKPSASPSTSPIDVPFASVRRANLYDDSSFSSTASPSGSEICSQHHGSFNGMTPSPSPPSASMSYGGYSHHHSAPSSQNSQADHRSHMGTHNTFYSVPPPLPNGAVHHMAGSSHSGPPIPRLEPLMSFPSRFSPMLSPSSPGSGSPLSAGLSAASFEREKHDKDHERTLLPPTPVSADVRHSDKQGFMMR
ncbi:hypothetical protein BKA93DRAFT_736867 [Sparassis latifolia]